MEFYEPPQTNHLLALCSSDGAKRWWLRKRTPVNRALRRMSDEQLKDIGLERKDVE
ncbi:DUF1127 domain-containing protein [Salmonella enterica subsp. enterica serovar Weltevreden]|nr:DUF1127 domain-containing protein [Salmonella enterica subsp. enterica serovar Weltevreden]